MKHHQLRFPNVSAPVGAFLALFLGVLAPACGARYDPLGPGPRPADPGLPGTQLGIAPTGEAAVPVEVEAPPEPVPAVVRPPRTRDILIGEMCPRGADGRAAVMPLFLRSTTWSIDGDDVSLPIERRTARNFSVLSWAGHRAGVFSIAGAADIGLDRRAAIGAYAGDSPCVVPTTAERADAADGERHLDTVCVRAQAGCGLAIAAVETSAMRPYEEDPDPLEVPVAGACLAGDKLLVDIDGDGIREAYAAASFLDPVRAPAEEVLAVNASGLQCTPTFARRQVLRGRNPKHFRGLDLVGVLDIDDDGRSEIIVAYHYSERRTWAVYTAASTVARLDLVGEAIPWSAR